MLRKRVVGPCTEGIRLFIILYEAGPRLSVWRPTSNSCNNYKVMQIIMDLQ